MTEPIQIQACSYETYELFYFVKATDMVPTLCTSLKVTIMCTTPAGELFTPVTSMELLKYHRLGLISAHR